MQMMGDTVSLTQHFSIVDADWQFRALTAVVRPLVQQTQKLMGWTPPDGIYVPEWRC